MSHFSVEDIKSRIFKDESGVSNYIHISIEEMDWIVEQAEQVESLKSDLKYWRQAHREDCGYLQLEIIELRKQLMERGD